MKKLIILIFFLIVTASVSKALPNLIPYRVGDKWGFCTPQKKVMIPIVFDDARPFYMGRAAVKGMIEAQIGWYYIDEKGRRISRLYQEIEDCQEGCKVSRVCLDSRWGLIDLNGKEILTPSFLYIRSFNNGRAWAVGENKKYCVITERGERLTDCRFDFINDFKDGYALGGIYKNGTTEYVILNHEGIIESKITYPFLNNFNSGLWVAKRDSSYGYLGKTGKVKIDFQYKQAFGYNENKALVRTKDNLLFVINKRGNKLFSLGNYDIGNDKPQFTCGMLPVFADGKWGYMTHKGQVSIDPEFLACIAFSSGIGCVKVGEKWIFLDKKGRQISDLQFDENMVANYWTANDFGYEFKGDLCKVIFQGKPGYIDKKGNIYWEN